MVEVWEAIPTGETNLDAVPHKALQVRPYIWASMTCLQQNLGTYIRVERAESLASRITSPACPILHQ